VPSSPTSETWQDEDTLLDVNTPKPPIKGYALNSDDDEHLHGDYDEQKPLLDDPSFDFDYEQSCLDDRSAINPPPDGTIRISVGALAWILASVLPQNTEVETPPSLSLVERVLASFTMYSELKAATQDSHYERVFTRLQMEWTCVGGLVRPLSHHASSTS